MKNLVSINQAITDEIVGAFEKQLKGKELLEKLSAAGDSLIKSLKEADLQREMFECPRQHGTAEIELKISNGEPF